MPIAIDIINSPSFPRGALDFLERNKLSWTIDKSATDAELLIEFSGRICYLSFGPGRQAPGSNAEYIQKIIANGHESVLEHASWTFVLSGVSRSFTHQLVRHRVGFSFSQLSQQYHDETFAPFVTPPGLEANPALLRRWTDAVNGLRSTYEDILSSTSADSSVSPRETLRLRRSIARSVLPNATETTIVVTANARALRHFLDVRGSIVGDIEMRLVSQKLLDEIQPQAPSVFADFMVTMEADGWPLVRRV